MTHSRFDPSIQTGLNQDSLQALVAAIEGAPKDPVYELSLRQRDRRLSLKVTGDGVAPIPALHNVGCLQDFMSGAVVYALVEQGRLDPQGQVGDYLTELRASDSSPGARIRVIDLLSHSSGYATPYHMPGRWEDLVDYLNGEPQGFPAGSVISYGAMEQALLLNLVQRATGRSLYEEIRERLFAPAGLTLTLGDSSIADRSRRAILASLDDVLRLVEQIVDPAGPWGEGFIRALRRDEVAAIHGPHLAMTRLPVGYAWGLAHFANGLWGQNGYSDAGALGLRISEDGGLALAGYFAAGQFWREQVIEQVCTALGHAAPATARGALGSANGLATPDLAGQYRSGPDARAEVFVDGAHLHALVFRDGRLLSNIRGLVQDDGLIVGTSRMPEGRIEFFPHPTTGAAALSIGLRAYVKG